jgi:hypothetical protein
VVADPEGSTPLKLAIRQNTEPFSSIFHFHNHFSKSHPTVIFRSPSQRCNWMFSCSLFLSILYEFLVPHHASHICCTNCSLLCISTLTVLSCPYKSKVLSYVAPFLNSSRYKCYLCTLIFYQAHVMLHFTLLHRIVEAVTC